MYPADVNIPINAKYFGFIDRKNPYNPHWDITWSFTFTLSGSNHAICTFLTNNPNLSAGIPGHYLGFQGSYNYLRDENSNILLSELGDELFAENEALTGYDMSGVIGIALDSTGYFALSNETNPGVGIQSIKPNSLIIRDSSSRVLVNESLSSLDSNFQLTTQLPQTIRIRWANGGRKLSVDYKSLSSDYKTLKSINLSFFDPYDHDALYPSFSFCSPLSGSQTPSTLKLKNFHTQGSLEEASHEILDYTPIIKSNKTDYTTISGITAIPI